MWFQYITQRLTCLHLVVDYLVGKEEKKRRIQNPESRIQSRAFGSAQLGLPIIVTRTQMLVSICTGRNTKTDLATLVAVELAWLLMMSLGATEVAFSPAIWSIDRSDKINIYPFDQWHACMHWTNKIALNTHTFSVNIHPATLSKMGESKHDYKKNNIEKHVMRTHCRHWRN